MKRAVKDITRTLISSDYVYAHISSLFPESVFLDRNYNIIGFSHPIQHDLGYSPEELTGRSIDLLEEHGQLTEGLVNLLKDGFFTDELITLISKTGEKILFSISGFYLGLIAEVSDLIVLRFRNLEETTLLRQQVHLTTHQMDHLIYRTGHDIRGPLATIQGLINLLKIRKDNSETDYFISLIDRHSDHLDENLHQLMDLAKVNASDHCHVR